VSRSEDKADHADLARALAQRAGCAVAVPNYRLTPNEPPPPPAAGLRHPAHAEDVLAFLSFIRAWTGPDASSPSPSRALSYDPSALVLLGHSCSAHMLACIVRDSSEATPSLTPPADLLGAVRAVVVSEGIYDLDLLLSSFPTYRAWFIENAFGPPDSASQYSKFDVTKYRERAGGDKIRWYVLHSTGDTLVDFPQSEAMVSSFGVSETADLLGGQEGRVKWDFSSLKEEHNDLLRGTTYVELVGSFVAGLP
jgi:acetyl esterase/lipase